MNVFISHATKDRDFVEQELLPLLQTHDVEAWYCRTDIPSAAMWKQEVLQALKQSERVVVVLSPHAVISEWVQAEVHWALENRRGRVIPLLYLDCDAAELDLRLAQLQPVNFLSSEAAAKARLVALLVDEDDEEEFPEDTLTVARTALQIEPVEKTRLRFTARAGPFAGREFAVETRTEAIIGRHRTTCDLRLIDTHVSRAHAKLTVTHGLHGKEIWIQDLKSANGTAVNGKRIPSPVQLELGDEVHIGESTLVLEEVS